MPESAFVLLVVDKVNENSTVPFVGVAMSSFRHESTEIVRIESATKVLICVIFKGFKNLMRYTGEVSKVKFL